MIVGQTKSKAEKPGLVPIVTRVSIMDIVIEVIIINVPVLVIVETFSRWPERTQQHLNIKRIPAEDIGDVSSTSNHDVKLDVAHDLANLAWKDLLLQRNLHHITMPTLYLYTRFNNIIICIIMMISPRHQA